MYIHKIKNNLIVALGIIITSLLVLDIKFSIIGIGILLMCLFIYKPLFWIYTMLTYVTFEVVILNFLPTSLIAPVRYGTELMSYLILIFSIIKLLAKKKKIKFYIYDKFIILFIFISITTSLINIVDIKIFAMGLRWIMRYLVIYYIFKFNDFSKKDLILLTKYFYYLIIIQIIIGLAQFVFRNQLDFILKPKVIDLEFHTITTSQLESKFAIFSTFGRYGEYAYFITLATIFLFIRYNFFKNKKNFVLLIIVSIVLILTYARQALLAVGVALIYYIYNKKNKVNISRVKVASLILSISVLFGTYLYYDGFQMGRGVLNESMAQRYLSIFSKEFIRGDYEGQGRTYFMTTVNKKILETKPMFGYGVGMYGTESAITYNQSVYRKLGIPTKFSMDVYSTSILGQTGILGLISLYGIYFAFYKDSNKINVENIGFEEFISIFVKLTCIVIIIQSFFGSNLSDRYQAFYVWMFFGIFDRLKVIKSQKNKEKLVDLTKVNIK